MVPILSLWLPIVVAAVVVFLASSLIHMVLPIHKSDYKKLPRESETLDHLRPQGLAPGLYHFPYCASSKEMGSPEILEKLRRGPVGILIIRPSGEMKLGSFLGQWFVYLLLVSLFVAYLAGRTLVPGAYYLAVFRVVGAAAFLAYGLGQIVNSIWMGHPWSSTVKHVVDGLVYALLTAGVFGWLWPR